MKLHAKTIYKMLLFLLVVLPIYQDSPLGLYIGAAGYTLAMPFSLIAIVIYILAVQRIPRNPRLKELLKLGFYLAAVSYIAIVVWLICGNEITVVSEFLPIKAFKVCLQYFSYPAYVALVLIAARKVGTQYIGQYAFVALMIITIICVIEKQQSPYAFQSLHFVGRFPYWRIRLLTTEASWTTMMIYVYTALSLYWSKICRKRGREFVVILCALILFINTGAKSLMVAAAFTVLVYALTALKRLKRRTFIKLMGVVVVAAVFAVIMLPELIGSFIIDIEQYTSVATRSYTCIIGLMIGVCFPFGIGGAVYLGVFQNALSRFLYIFQKLPVKLNTSEIIGLATSSTDMALTVKSGMLQYNMYWGIIGTVYLFKNFLKVSYALKQSRAKHIDILWTAFWCAVIMTIIVCNFTFEFWLLYAFIVCLNEKSALLSERKSGGYRTYELQYYGFSNYCSI